ncbi:hypothetical protein K6U06_10345 [Acidiferrimicrobium sp. IK]|uniref:hypothetical protein n=1 Tax=Acidiferrimicrobium sp. IK TaxID=2871700 RepID=UPI0021CB98A1|nr:hypothetical protein [Acidiferrimicrobium sp. IK]MCU4184760.1 hypothetical protein [Acidiferrimicrobium sp. IK]
MLNYVVLHGTLTRSARAQVLASEAVLLRLELRTRTGDGPADSVPVVWFDPPAWGPSLEADADLVVVGRVRRRFFSAGGATQSRTEVVADRVVRAGSRRRAARALVEAAVSLEAAAVAVEQG